MTKEKRLQGFKPLSIRYSKDSDFVHQIFMKEHSVRNQTEDQPLGRTLYLVNVPPWVTKHSLQVAFSTITSTESVVFSKPKKQPSNDGFKNAFIVFSTENGLYEALKTEMLPPLSKDEEPIVLGLSKWIQEYNDAINGQHNLEQQMLEIVKSYDKAQETKKKMEEKAMETDDEGWTLVTKNSRNPGLSRTENVNNRLTQQTNKKEKVLKNFYRHQIRQARKDQLAQLRKKAEEDKKKVLALKQRRAFKPF